MIMSYSFLGTLVCCHLYLHFSISLSRLDILHWCHTASKTTYMLPETSCSPFRLEFSCSSCDVTWTQFLSKFLIFPPYFTLSLCNFMSVYSQHLVSLCHFLSVFVPLHVSIFTTSHILLAAMLLFLFSLEPLSEYK